MFLVIQLVPQEPAFLAVISVNLVAPQMGLVYNVVSGLTKMFSIMLIAGCVI